MKYLLFTIVIMSSAAFAETLTTDSFIIQIEQGCEEGEVTCDTMRFIYSAVGAEQEQTVVGTTVHTTCADGVTPCAFQGYEFSADGANYFIHHTGVLKVTDCKGNQLLVEHGQWQY